MGEFAKKFENSVTETDSIFKAPTSLRDAYQNFFQKVQEEVVEGSHISNRLDTFKQGFDSAKMSAEAVERDNFDKLAKHGIVSLVSVAESHLRDICIEYVKENIKTLPSKKYSNKKSFSITISELMDASVTDELNSDWVAVKIVEKLKNLENEDKLNFQNIDSVKHIFKEYLDKEISSGNHNNQDVFKYFQIRHVIVHNQSVVDKRFIDCMDKYNAMHNYSEGDIITLKKDDYEYCRTQLISLFEDIDKSLAVITTDKAS